MEPLSQADPSSEACSGTKADTVQNLVGESLARGIAYLEQHQYPSGEFCCYMAPDDAMQQWCTPDSTIFPTALIATALLPLAHLTPVTTMLSRTAQFLAYEQLKGGVWNYYTHWHPMYKFTPADVDDTVYVSAFLKAYRGTSFPNAPVLLANRNKQGLFFTWFVLRPRAIINRTYWRVPLREVIRPIKTILFWLKNDCTRSDIDGVVNANALYYLGDIPATQPIINYLIRIIAEGKEAVCDKWYQNPFTVYYFISRNYYNGIIKLESARQAVIDRIVATAQPDGRLGESELDTALGICTLLNWRSTVPELERAINFLIQAQRHSGEWPRRLLYYSGPKRVVGWGSEELTTGFCVEALSRYHQLVSKGNQLTV